MDNFTQRSFKEVKLTDKLEIKDIIDSDDIEWNLNPAELYEHAIVNSEALLTNKFALRVLTGQYTGRSPKDKFIVNTPHVKDDIDWGEFNQPISSNAFDKLYQKMLEYLKQKKLYVKDLYACADSDYRLNIRFISEAAYHALFVHNMFIGPGKSELETFYPDFTVLAAPFFQADPHLDGTRSSTFILCDFEKKMILIGGTLYSGELKKGIFSVLNYLLPQKGVLPMHCSANMDRDGNTALFFGLSGTGKTTLSSDTERILIGDDEHGWSDKGVFNFEGGCYAKTINLSYENEPLIYATTERPGTILENVILDEKRQPIFDDCTITENTRCAYPISYIPNASKEGMGQHPKNIIYLTLDAFGVLPIVSKLTIDQAIYYFLNGYTAKVAGTERDVTEPKVTFSSCFGAPFIPLKPIVYSNILAEKINKHNTNVWLINTGWVGGPYGIGYRINLKYTRRIISEILKENLKHSEFETDSFFGLSIPQQVQGVPSDLLNPSESWDDQVMYHKQANKLISMFEANYARINNTLK